MVKTFQTLSNTVNSVAVTHACIVKGQPQKNGISQGVVRQHQFLKYVNNVSCVDQLSFLKPVTNV